MSKDAHQTQKSPSQLIDERIRDLGDWRGEMLSRLRTLIKQAVIPAKPVAKAIF